MNNIPSKQNEQRQLERLAAQREIYSAAKKLHVSQIVLTVVGPILLFIANLMWPMLGAYYALYGIVVIIIDGVLIEPIIKTKKTKAAKIQELFDCDVLELETSPLKVVDDITVEEILLYYNAHSKVKTNIEKIRDWYPKNIEQLPISIARIICQRANCWWDSNLRRRYSNFLKYTGLFIFLSLLVYAFLAEFSLIQFVLIGSGLIPLFQFCNKQYTDHRDAASRLDELVCYSQNVWSKTISLENPHLAKDDSRRLQDEIFEHRCKSPLILDLFFKVFRDEHEELMNKSTDILIEEFNKAAKK
jgi:hypothetical protein